MSEQRRFHARRGTRAIRAATETQKIGMVEPSLQYIRLILAQHSQEAQDAERIGYAAPHAERAYADPMIGELGANGANGARRNHAHDRRAKPLLVHRRDEFNQHCLSTTDVEIGDEVHHLNCVHPATVIHGVSAPSAPEDAALPPLTKNVTGVADRGTEGR
jgi:hypothetical protein